MCLCVSVCVSVRVWEWEELLKWIMRLTFSLYA